MTGTTGTICPRCSLPRVMVAGYVGPHCLCVWQVPPITEDTIRRIVREEIERARKEVGK